MPKKMTRAQRNIRWIEDYCHVPEGSKVGQPVRLEPWQKDELKRIYDNKAVTRRAILSFARKNGKTALAAMLLLLHLVGPEARVNSQLFSAAQSRDQAAILFSLAAKMVRMSGGLSSVVKIRDTAKQLYCEELGTLYRALSAEASVSFGLSPVFLVHDELGQVQGPLSQLYEALETATGAQDNPLSIVISTQAPTDSDLLSVLIDDAQEGHDPHTVVSVYTSNPDDDPFEERTIRQANPAFGKFQKAEEIMSMAEAARRMPSREASYRNLILNQRVEASSPFVTKAVWDENDGSPDEFRGPIYGGLDLSDSGDLTALVLAYPSEGQLHIRPFFWLPEDGLTERSRQDRVPYDVWHNQGYLHTTPGRSVEYEYIASVIAGLFKHHDIRKIAFDRWNMKHLRPWLVRSGLNEEFIDDRFENFGQGFVSMSPALRALESMLLNGKVRHGAHPVMQMCARNAVVQSDPAGNRKLDKRKSRGRIDGMVSLAMAASMAESALEQSHVFSSVDLEDILE